MTKQEHWVSARGCVYNIYYHMVWSTRYRKPVLVGDVECYLKELNESIARDHGITLVEQEVMPDHLFGTAHPKFSPCQIVKIFKGVSAKSLFEKFPELKTQLWGGHLWNPSYYCGTMSRKTRFRGT